MQKVVLGDFMQTKMYLLLFNDKSGFTFSFSLFNQISSSSVWLINFTTDEPLVRQVMLKSVFFYYYYLRL